MERGLMSNIEDMTYSPRCSRLLDHRLQKLRLLRYHCVAYYFPSLKKRCKISPAPLPIMNTNPPFHPPQRTPHRPRRLPEHLLRLQAEYGTTQQAIFRLADLWMKIYDLEQALQNREIHPRDISEARRDLAGLKFDYEAFEEDARGLRDRRLLWVHGRGWENEGDRVEERREVEGPRLGGLRPFPRGRLPVMHGALEGWSRGQFGIQQERGVPPTVTTMICPQSSVL